MGLGTKAERRKKRMKRRTKGKRRVVIESGKVGHDVIIAGGSFAGLAVASQIHGRNLLIEPNGIGEYPTSACGTLLGVPERLGLTKGVLQVPRVLAVHARTDTKIVDISDPPFCTFDCKTFCQGMATAVRGDILRARVLCLSDRKVVTDKGIFFGEILVDASGRRAVLENHEGRDFGADRWPCGSSGEFNTDVGERDRSQWS